jgi:hypothetical protein
MTQVIVSLYYGSQHHLDMSTIFALMVTSCSLPDIPISAFALSSAQMFDVRGLPDTRQFIIRL